MHYNNGIRIKEAQSMATTKRVFTLRLTDEVFDKIGALGSENKLAAQAAKEIL